MQYMENKTKRVLHGEAELRAHVLGPFDSDDFYTASDVVVEEIDRIAAGGAFPYNSAVQRAVEARLNLERQNDNGSNLSRVVYTSQDYRDYQRLVKEGFQPFTPELLQQAWASGCQIELCGESIVGTALRRLNVREIDGKLYAMQPRKRKFHIPPQGQPVRLVTPEAPARPRATDAGGPQLLLID